MITSLPKLIFWIMLEGNVESAHITTSSFRKKCVGNTILNAHSCHPRHTIDAIPIGEYIRTKRACTNPETYDTKIKELKHRLTAQGYHKKHFHKATTKVADRSREFPYFPDYYYFANIRKIFFRYLPILNRDSKSKSILEMGCKVVPKRGRTLGNILSPSDINTSNAKTCFFQPGSYPCGGNRCNSCKLTTRKKDFIDSNNKKVFKIHQFINCNTTFVVYCIKCLICKLNYVG